MNNSSNNNWITENPLFKNKNQRYYYDFGTGKQIEREDVKEKREAFLNAASKTSNKPTNQKNDDFLKGFNDPYGEKGERERKEKLAKIRENSDNRTWISQGTSDPFLEGFNHDSTDETHPTFRGSQFEGELKPTVQRRNSSPTITTAINRNPNAKNEFKHAIADTNKKYSATQYSANSKESFIDKVFSKEFNNNIYTSKDNSYTEKSKGMGGIFQSDFYYVEKDGKRYPANSKETVDYYDWNSIDENFLNGKFLNLIEDANKKPAHILRVLTQSIDGELDFKNKLDENTLYLINGVLYNKNEAGNFAWAYFLESHKYSGLFSGALAQAGTLLPSLSKMNSSARLDEEWDRRARWAGVRYYYEKNNKLALYYYLYGNKIKY